MRYSVRNEKGRFTPSKPLDVRKEKDAKEAEKLIQIGPITFVLIHADWCGHCQTYKPLWQEFEEMVDRQANIIKVHHDMVENIPSIKNANIQGYPSVIKVLPGGEIQSYKKEGSETTHAMPNMRNVEEMKNEMMNVENTAAEKVLPNILSRVEPKQPQAGGALQAVSLAFLGALKKVGPTALLLAAHETLPKKKTYKSPKKSTRRASTRKHRTRKN